MNILKPLAIGALVIGITWAGASYSTGQSTRSAYDSLLTQLNSQMVFKVSNEEYISGIAKSTAITTVKDSDEPDAEVLFKLKHEINHQPIKMVEDGIEFGAASIATSIVISEKNQEVVNKVFATTKQGEPILLTTDVAFDGTLKHQLFIGAVDTSKIDTPKGDLISDQTDYTLMVGNGMLKGSGDIGKADLKADDARITVSPTTLDMDWEKIANSVYEGQMDFSIDSIKILAPEKKFEALINDTELVISNISDDDLLDSRVNLQVGNVHTASNIKGGSLAIGSKNIAISALPKYLTQITESVVTKNKSKVRVEFKALSLESLINTPEIFTPDAGVYSDLSVRTKDGDIAASFNLAIADQASGNYPENGITKETTAGEVLNMLVADITFKADALALKGSSFEQGMSSGQAAMFFERTEDSIQSNVRLEESTLYINGRPLSLSLLLSEVLNKPIGDLAVQVK